MDIIDDRIVLDLKRDKVEKANFGTGKEVGITALWRIDKNLVPRSTSSTRDDKELAALLKTFVGMAMSTEKETGLSVVKKRINKECSDLLVRPDHPAVGQWRLMAADNDIVNSFVLFKSF
jgi:hypothetical protein